VEKQLPKQLFELRR